MTKGLPPLTNPASEMIRAVDGLCMPGGCDYCDAEQTVRADFYGRDQHSLAIAHDPWCPVLVRCQSLIG